mgnify:FL=1
MDPRSNLQPLPEWEEAAEKQLAESDYDAELGKQLACDAIKVANGEMDEETFHEKHHEDVVAEFGVDHRPTEPEGFDD